MKSWNICGLLLFLLSALTLRADLIDVGTAGSVVINLGAAGSFAVLGGETVTNTGTSNVSGNVGVYPGTAITGFPPGVITNGAKHSADAVAAQAQTVAFTPSSGVYDILAALPAVDLTGQNLGGRLLTPGVYSYDFSAQLTGALTLDAQNDPNAGFVFRIGTALTTAENSSVVTINGANCCNIFWLIGSSATLGTGTQFQGTILAQASITATTGAAIAGRALANSGAVTLDTNVITNPVCETAGAVPEPGTAALLGAGLCGLIFLGRRSRRRAA